MIHPQIEHEEVIERYVRNQLTPDERQAFEEHFFACDECFEKLQATARFVAGVRDAGRRGLLGAASSAVAPAQEWARWTLPAFVASACASVVLALVSGLAYFSELPALRRHVDGLSNQLRNETQARAVLENEMAAAHQAEANLPLVILQATREVESPADEVVLPEDAQTLVLWIESGAGRARVFRVQIFTNGGRLLLSINDVKRNAYNALAISVPARDLQPGEYKITLSAQEPASTPPLGEYRLKIRRP